MYYSYVSYYHPSLNLHFKFLSHNPILLSSSNVLLFANLAKIFAKIPQLLIGTREILMENLNTQKFLQKVA